MHPINPNDTLNAPPVSRLYDRSRKKEYYSINQIKDTYVKQDMKQKRKQLRMKQQVKESLRSKSYQNNRRRDGIGNARLKRSMHDRKQWNNDMSNTTNLRKHRNFKPSG